MFPIKSSDAYIKDNGKRSTIGAELGAGGGGTDLPEYSEVDAGKVLTVGDDGDLVWNTPEGGGVDVLGDEILPSNSVGENGNLFMRYSPSGAKNASGQYVSTGYDATPNTKFEIDFKLKSNPGAGIVQLFGGRPTISSAGGSISFAFTAGTPIIYWGSNSYKTPNFPHANSLIDKYVHVELSAGSATMAIDDMPMGDFTWSSSGVTATTDIGLYGVTSKNAETGEISYSQGISDVIIYGFKIYESNVLTHDYKPVVDNNTLKFHDSVTDTYITVNTGELTRMTDKDIISTYLKDNNQWKLIQNYKWPISE